MKKIVTIAGWLAAALLAGYLFVTQYLADNPFPTGSDSTTVVAPE